eukprot:282374_1
MPTQENTNVYLYQLLLLLVTFIRLKSANNQRNERTSILRSPYNCTPMLDITTLASDPARFKKMTRFEPDIWYTQFFQPMEEQIQWPRCWYQNVGIDSNEYPFKKKACNLSAEERLLRFNFYCTGIDYRCIELFFGQSKSVFYEDIDHIAKIGVKVLSAKWLTHPAPNTTEYDALVGAGVFEDIFDITPYAMDVVKIKIRKPQYGQRDYYDGHHKQHDIGFLVMCDGYGIVRYFYGGAVGRTNDIRMYSESDLFNNTQNYVQDGHYILADGIFRYFPPPLLTRYCNRQHLSEFEHAFNYQHSECRVIIENVFGRMKTLFPIIIIPWSLLR